MIIAIALSLALVMNQQFGQPALDAAM